MPTVHYKYQILLALLRHCSLNGVHPPEQDLNFINNLLQHAKCTDRIISLD